MLNITRTFAVAAFAAGAALGTSAMAQQVGGTDDKGGSVVITAKYGGDKKPARKALDVSSDPYCVNFYKGKDGGGPLNEKWVWSKDETSIANVFVSVSKGLEGKKFAAPDKPAVIDQVGCMYSPHVLGVVVGQKLKITNSDSTLHNVHGLPKINTEWNIGQPVKGMANDFVLGKVEEGILVKCDVHAWMNSYVHVVAHPFFAVTGDDGTCTIKGLPAGEYELTVWHEFKTFVPDNATIKVTVKEGEAAKATVTYAPKKAG